MESQESISDTYESTSLPALPRQPRMQLHKGSVCSRTYFVVVMVFFHVYIINVIALLLYVHYNTGQEEAGTSVGDPSITRKSSTRHTLPDPDQSPDLGSHVTVHLPRIEGIRVGHVQKVSLVHNKVHEMRTLSLKPLLFEIPDFLSEEECRVVVQLAQLKGLTESQITAPESQDETTEMLDLSPEEVFNLLDLNQDGQLQLQEILTHSSARDRFWLTPENLQEIYAGLKADPNHNGFLSLGEFKRLSSRALWRFSPQLGGKRNQQVWNSRHTWLYQGKGAHHVLRALRKRVTRLTQLSPLLVELSEPLQVVRYEQGGHHYAHHDSGVVHPEAACTHTRLAANTSTPFETSCRYITVLLYLNSVEEGGETTFPVADNRTYDEQALFQNGVDLRDTRKNCDKGNLRVKPTQGTAIFWYNHLSDGKGWVGELDEYSLHGDCILTRGTKWVANNWINIDPDNQRQARYQRLVAQKQEDEAHGGERNADQHNDLHQDL